MKKFELVVLAVAMLVSLIFAVPTQAVNPNHGGTQKCETCHSPKVQPTVDFKNKKHLTPAATKKPEKASKSAKKATVKPAVKTVGKKTVEAGCASCRVCT